MMLVIGVVMDELVHAWTDRENRCPLEHCSDEQSANCFPQGDSWNLPVAGLLNFPGSVH
jgi:hypothetical protein